MACHRAFNVTDGCHVVLVVRPYSLKRQVEKGPGKTAGKPVEDQQDTANTASVAERETEKPMDGRSAEEKTEAEETAAARAP